MTDLFKDIIPSILQTGEEVITAENERAYVPYMVNKALSYHYDCILWANELNKLPHTDKLMQYHVLLNTIRRYKRPFAKWVKLENSEDLKAIKQYFNLSNDKAKEALRILTPTQIEEIKKKLEIGGFDGGKRI